jgi:hypothetical protein
VGVWNQLILGLARGVSVWYQLSLRLARGVIHVLEVGFCCQPLLCHVFILLVSSLLQYREVKKLEKELRRLEDISNEDIEVT